MSVRTLLVLGAALTALMLEPPAAAASYGAWCLKARTGRSVAEICRFATFEACNRERHFYGTTSFCVQSQYRVPGIEPQQRKIRKRKR